MRVVIQRVSHASVSIANQQISKIGKGLLVLVGIELEDGRADCDFIVEKVVGLRVFEDEHGKMNLSLGEVGGELLVVSQFTLLGDCRRGRRPSFTQAARPEQGSYWYQAFCDQLCEHGLVVKQGQFGADMNVEICNQGPVTLLLDSRKRF